MDNAIRNTRVVLRERISDEVLVCDIYQRSRSTKKFLNQLEFCNKVIEEPRRWK
jgi:hypothetical protein